MSIHVAESIIPSIATDCRTFWPRRLSSINCQLRTKLTRPMRQLVGTGLVCSNNLASPALPPHPSCPSHLCACSRLLTAPSTVGRRLPSARRFFKAKRCWTRATLAITRVSWGDRWRACNNNNKSTTTKSQQQQQVNKYTQQQHKNKSINSVTVLYVYNRKHWLYRCKYTTYVCVCVCVYACSLCVWKTDFSRRAFPVKIRLINQ